MSETRPQRPRRQPHSSASAASAETPARVQVRAAQAVARTAAQEVRIIGGQWKRSVLPVPVSAGLRPTPARVRETLFNWVGQDLSGWRVLDAFAGSGALGFEAASRGAQEVVLLEREAMLARGLQAVQRKLKAQQVRVERADAVAWMRQARHAESFDLVFLDPPFDEALFWPALDAALSCVAASGWIYLEAPAPLKALPGAQAHADVIGRLAPHREGRAGAVHFHLFQCVAAGREAPQPGV